MYVQCPKCGKGSHISLWKKIHQPQGESYAYFECPKCGATQKIQI